MAASILTDRSLRELLSAAAVDPTLRRRLKVNAHAVLTAWGVRAPGRTVYFVEPGESPADGRPGDTFVELPALTPALDDQDLDAVAGGWDQARDLAVDAVNRAVEATDWRHSDPWA